MLRPVLMDEHEGLYIRFDDVNRKLGEFEKRVKELEEKEKEEMYGFFPFNLYTSFQGYAYAIYTQNAVKEEETSVTDCMPGYRLNSLWSDETPSWYRDLESDYDYTYYYTSPHPDHKVKYYIKHFQIPRFDLFGVETESRKKVFTKTDYEDNILAIVYCNREPNLLVSGACDCQPNTYTYKTYPVTTQEENYLDSVADTEIKNSYELPVDKWEDGTPWGSSNTVPEFGPCFFTPDGYMISSLRYIRDTTGRIAIPCYAPVEKEVGMPYIIEKYSSAWSQYRPCVTWSQTPGYLGARSTILSPERTYTKLYDFTGIHRLADLNKAVELNPSITYSPGDGAIMQRIREGGHTESAGYPRRFTYPGRPEYPTLEQVQQRELDWEIETANTARNVDFGPEAHMPSEAFISQRKFGGEEYLISCRYGSTGDTSTGFLTMGMSYYTPTEAKKVYRIKRVPEYDRVLSCKGVACLEKYKDENLYQGKFFETIPDRMKPLIQKLNKEQKISINPLVVFED